MTAPIRSVLIVGSGLIGASLGLALRERGLSVWLEDADPAAVEIAVSRGAGLPGPPPHDPDLVMVAVPPAVSVSVIVDTLGTYLNATVSDVS